MTEAVIVDSEANINLSKFDPRVFESLTLQTYEFFGSDPNRTKSKKDYASSSDTHLRMAYPKLEEGFTDIRDELQERRELALQEFGAESATVSSIEYRLEEVDFLDAAAQMNKAAKEGDSVAAQEYATTFTVIGERLYGKPDDDIDASVFGSIRERYDIEDDRVQQLWSELESGFSIELSNGELIEVPAIKFPDEFAPLPELDQEAEQYLRHIWQIFSGVLMELQAHKADQNFVRSFGGEEVEGAPSYKDTIFSGEDLFKIFKMASVAIAQQHKTSQFGVELDPEGSAASWHSGRRAVVVGKNRSEKLGEWSKVRGTVPHEAVHGLKSVNGSLITQEPALTTGVFTRNELGNWVSYLDYEEGNNKLGESLLMHKDRIIEDIENDYGYIIVARLAYQGLDDRQITEVMKKLYEIENIVLHPETEFKIDSAAQRATTRVERIFRGTPVDPTLRVDGHMPIFTKDLAYYYGRVIAINDWNVIYQEAVKTGNPLKYMQEQFELRNRGKINPTDKDQLSLVL